MHNDDDDDDDNDDDDDDDDDNGYHDDDDDWQYFLPGKITGGESVRVTGCVCHDETSDKFRFSVTGEDLNSGTGTGNGITSSSGGEMVTYNVQVRGGFNRPRRVGE